jgi:adenylyltransferase/sulfurtransferase
MLLLLDLLSLEQRKIATTRREDCLHGTAMPERATLSTAATLELEISLQALTPAVRAEYVLVDVREPHEIAGDPLVPRAQLQIPLTALLDDHRALDPNHRYLVVCARGTRSRSAAEHLREQGFAQVYSLRGGVLGLHG